MNDAADANATDTGRWVILDAKNGARRLVLRLRTDRPATADVASHSTAVMTRWAYPERAGSAEPPEDEGRRMSNLEGALSALTAGNGFSFLMCAGTGLGSKDWVYYTRDANRFMQRLNELLAGHEPYPIEIEFFEDPSWKIWLDLRHGYERAGGEPAGLT